MVKTRLELKVGHQLVLTPQLQQAIRLLQMSSLELSDYIHEQLLSNPMLEEKTTTQTSKASEHDDATPMEVNEEHFTDAHQDMDIPDYAKEHNQSTDNPTSSTTQTDQQHDFDTMDGFSQFSQPTSSSAGSSSRLDDDVALIELVADQRKDIRSVVMAQFHLISNDNKQRIIASQMLDDLDDAGWFTADLQQIASQIGCPLNEIEEVLLLLQKCEPPGIFARSLKECITLQLQHLGIFDETFAILVDNLEDIASGNSKKLERKTKKSLEEIKTYVATIRKLQPKPATLYTSEVAPLVTPDILVYRDSRHRWQVTLNTQNLPNIHVKRRFYQHARKQVVSQDEKNFISDNFQNASWLVKSIQQRNHTLLRVAQHIVQHQQLFFDRGIEAIKPMILKEIASRTQLHESTISRITTNKFIATPWGTFELKYFFNVSLGSADGKTTHATNSVKHSIKQMIDKEKPPHILSDDKLVQNLAEQGIHIARRTVTKYREALHIPSSIIRRQQKNQIL